jgi:hypothetical protein
VREFVKATILDFAAPGGAGGIESLPICPYFPLEFDFFQWHVPDWTTGW